MTVRWLEATEQRAWRTYLESSKVLLDALDRRLHHDAELPHAYYEILVRLSEADGRALRMSELAEATLSSRSRLSHAVARLEERGWVTREDCPTDRRGQVATLTDEGFATLAAAAPDHVSAVRSYLIDALTPEQLDQLTVIGEAVLAQVRAADRTRAGVSACPSAAPATSSGSLSR